MSLISLSKIIFKIRFKNKNNLKKILIVDDNEYIKKAIKRQITEIFQRYNKHYDIEEGSDGLDILNSIIQDQFLGNKIVRDWGTLGLVNN